MKTVVKTWRNRLPIVSDDLSHWSSIFMWRQHHYQGMAFWRRRFRLNAQFRFLRGVRLLRKNALRLLLFRGFQEGVFFKRPRCAEPLRVSAFANVSRLKHTSVSTGDAAHTGALSFSSGDFETTQRGCRYKMWRLQQLELQPALWNTVQQQRANKKALHSNPTAFKIKVKWNFSRWNSSPRLI